MPKGPLGFPRLTDKGPLVDSVTPTIDLEPGVYPFRELESNQGKTAEDTSIFMDRILRVDNPEESKFRYGKFSISDMVVDGGFIPTLSKYVGEDHHEVEESVIAGDIPKEDISSLVAGFPHDLGHIDAADKMMRDVKRVNEIYDKIDNHEEYWPPTFEKNRSTLDGAHRVAALYHFVGIQNKIYAWELINPDEIGVE